MEWYYAVGDKQMGPVNDEEFKRLGAEGTIRPDTLVWRAGQDNWRPYRDAIASAAGTTAQPPLTMAASPDSASAGGAPGAGSVVCRECGQIFPPEDVVKFGDASVCAACKPVYVQRMREGGRPPGEMEYAGFWIRFAAKIIDNLILFIPLIILVMVLIVPTLSSGGSPDDLGIMLQLVLQLVYYAMAAVFNIFFVGKYGATPGKMACKLRVVTAEGEKVSYGRATGRFFAEILSGLVCYIGYIIAGFDDQKRALHDHIASTRVVRN